MCKETTPRRRENALYELYEKLTDRFLLHVHDEEHLHAIIALAITTDANKDLLVSYWGGTAMPGPSESGGSGAGIRCSAAVISIPWYADTCDGPFAEGSTPRKPRPSRKALSEIVARPPATPSFDDRYFQHKAGQDRP